MAIYWHTETPIDNASVAIKTEFPSPIHNCPKNRHDGAWKSRGKDFSENSSIDPQKGIIKGVRSVDLFFACKISF